MLFHTKSPIYMHAEQATHDFNTRSQTKRYMDRMNSSKAAKFEVIQPLLSELRTKENPLVVSIGAGSGLLESDLARSGMSVLALDLSLPMLDTINGQAEEVEAENQLHLAEPGFKPGHIWAVEADAEALPLAQAAHAILCFSVLHEVASFGHGYDFDQMSGVFAQIVSKLELGGYLMIRDFVQPTNPQSLVRVQVGKAMGAELNPTEFVAQFARKFKGDELSSLKFQVMRHRLAGTWGPGAVLRLTRAQAMELIAHYSWHSSPEEIEEKYAYLPLREYAEFVIKAAATQGMELKVIECSATRQAGYDEHTAGRLDIVDAAGQRELAPVLTGVLVFQRQT